MCAGFYRDIHAAGFCRLDFSHGCCGTDMNKMQGAACNFGIVERAFNGFHFRDNGARLQIIVCADESCCFLFSFQPVRYCRTFRMQSQNFAERRNLFMPVSSVMSSTASNSLLPVVDRNALNPMTPDVANGSRSSSLPGTSPPQRPKSTTDFSLPIRAFSSSASSVTVEGMPFSGISKRSCSHLQPSLLIRW